MDWQDSAAQELARQCQELRTRVEAIESRLGIERAAAVALPAESAPAAMAVSGPDLGDAASAATLAGISFLGLAAAYLLRAATEARVLPPAGGVALGILYALAWLVWAARTPRSEVVTVGVRSLTSVLIVAPLLWEARLRFEAISSWAAAGVILLFSLFGLGISWRKNLTAIAWISSLGGLGMAAATMLATYDLVPFVFAFLVLGAAVECSACLEHWLGERWIVACAADLAVLLLTYVATRPGGIPEAYVPMRMASVLALQAGLLSVYLAATFVRTLARGFQITSFEIAQCVAAFALATTGAIQTAHGDAASVLAVALFCLAGGMACYAVSFAFLAKDSKRNRNFQVYTLFGLALTVTGTWLLSGGLVLNAIWSALAVACAFIGSRSERVTLVWHSGAYLVLAVIASGLASAFGRQFLGSDGHAADWTPDAAAWVAALAAGLSWAAALRARRRQSPSRNLRLACTLLAGCVMASFGAIAASLFSPLCVQAAARGSGDYCPAWFTAVLVLLVAASAIAAQRHKLEELAPLAYIYLAVATYKLVAQDLPHGRTFGIVISLVLYGGTMVALPRILRRGRSVGARAAAGS